MKGKAINFRPTPEMRARLMRLAKATGHSLSYHIERAIDAHLPELERRYSRELKELAAQTEKYPVRPDLGIYVEDKPPKKKAG